MRTEVRHTSHSRATPGHRQEPNEPSQRHELTVRRLGSVHFTAGAMMAPDRVESRCRGHLAKASPIDTRLSVTYSAFLHAKAYSLAEVASSSFLPSTRSAATQRAGPQHDRGYGALAAATLAPAPTPHVASPPSTLRWLSPSLLTILARRGDLAALAPLGAVAHPGHAPVRASRQGHNAFVRRVMRVAHGREGCIPVARIKIEEWHVLVADPVHSQEGAVLARCLAVRVVAVLSEEAEEGLDGAWKVLVPFGGVVHELIVPGVELWRLVMLRVLVVQLEHRREVVRVPRVINCVGAAKATRAAAVKGVVRVAPAVVTAARRSKCRAIVAIGALELDVWVDDDASAPANERYGHAVPPLMHTLEDDHRRNTAVEVVGLASVLPAVVTRRPRPSVCLEVVKLMHHDARTVWLAVTSGARVAVDESLI